MTASAPRWAQLTYSSFDRKDGTGGGWQVKDTTGGLDHAERELLRGRVQTQFDSGSVLPRFPTPAELEELPRRLVYAPAELSDAGAVGTASLPRADSHTGLWHQVAAGTDASGRPGNVFAHIVLDRNPAADDSQRPIERWRSPDWLTPFGPEAVLAATLASSEPPRPGPLNRQTIGSWLFAPRRWRMQTLAVLLDAVRAGFSGGPMVVLGAEDPDEAAHWIAGVSCAMSAGTARRFFFSTLERPATLHEAARRGLQLVCVPRADLGALTRRNDLIVIDPAGAHELGDLGGAPHRTPRGDQVPVGEWSVLIQEVFGDPAALVAGVGEFDRIARAVGDSGLDPAWPAAMLVADRPQAESRREAAQVIAECAPPQLRAVPELYATAVSGLRQQLEGKVDRAWQQVTKLGADSEATPATTAGEVAVGIYAELALAETRGLAKEGLVEEPRLVDEHWLAAPGPAKLPSTHYFTPLPEPGLVRLALQLCPQISPFDAALPRDRVLAATRAGLHCVELALRLGLAHDEELARELWRVCQECLVPVLLDPELGALLMESVQGLVAQETRHWLWSQLAGAELGPGLPGQRVAPAVLAALGPGPADPDPLTATWEWLSEHPDPETAVVSPLVGELAWHRIQQADSAPNVRFVAAWASLAVYARDGDPGVLPPAGQLFTPPWDLERLIQLHLRWPDLAPPEWFLRALAEAPLDDPFAGFLGGQLAERTGESPVIGFAEVRGALAGPQWLTAAGAGAPAALSRRLTDLAEGLAVARHQRAVVDRELLRRADGLVVLGLLAARSRVPDLAEPQDAERAAGLVQAAVAGFGGVAAGFSAEEAHAVALWCDEVGVTTAALTELFLHADPRSALRSADLVAGWLHAFGTGAPDSPPITALVLATRLGRDAESRDRVSEEILAALRATPGSADERALRQAERFLTGWLRQAQTGKVRR